MVLSQKGRWVTLSTSVTNPIKQRLKKTILWYTLISAFFFVGSRIYEHFSFGETSAFMHYLFLIPLIGGALLVLLQLMVKGLSRLSLNLWNSGVATLTAGALYRGIVNLSGRSTTMDQPYYYLGVAFLALADQPLLCPQCLGGKNKVKYLILKALIQLLWIRAFNFNVVNFVSSTQTLRTKKRLIRARARKIPAT